MLRIFVVGMPGIPSEKGFKALEDELKMSIVDLLEFEIEPKQIEVTFLNKYPGSKKIDVFITHLSTKFTDKDRNEKLQNAVRKVLERHSPGVSVKFFVSPRMS